MLLFGVLLLLVTLFVMLVGWLPFRRRGISLAAWSTTAVARVLFRVLDVRYDGPGSDRLRQHHGFVFPNHVSYFDILTAIYIMPMRFLAKAEVQRMPLVGYLATAVGCAFVQRDSRASRAAARAELARIDPYPPLVLFPEGKRGPGDALLPLRYGAFEIAVAGQIPVQPVVYHYSQPDVVIWHRHESILTALWRLCRRPGHIVAAVTFLPLIEPQADDGPVALAEATHAAMNAIYLSGFPQRDG